jgi:protein-L-isoaspartate(D-aspartate) O-methyltransferase
MDFAAARKVMVDSQVRVNDVTDRALQAALLAVPRERFLPADRAGRPMPRSNPRSWVDAG